MDLICIDYISYCFSRSSALDIWIWVLQRVFLSSHSPCPSSNPILYLEHTDFSCGIAIVLTGNFWSSQLDWKYVFCITRINFFLYVVQVTLNLLLDIYIFHATSKNASFQISLKNYVLYRFVSIGTPGKTKQHHVFVACHTIYETEKSFLGLRRWPSR